LGLVDADFRATAYEFYYGSVESSEQMISANKSLQATATAPVSPAGDGNLIVTVAFRSQSPVAVPEL
jgi:hypothetical protein